MLISHWSGTLAILAAQPTDVVKVRMQAGVGRYLDNTLTRHWIYLPWLQGGRQYSGVVDAYRSIWRVEGVAGGLYRGTLPNIARNCIINVGETGATPLYYP